MYDKQRLLEDMVNVVNNGIAEHESENEQEYMKNFLPIPSHQRAMDPSILLVLGGRGAGKSMLFKSLSIQSARRLVRKNNEIKNEFWIPGFGQFDIHLKFPAQESIEKALEGASNYRLRSFWQGLWVGTLLKSEYGEEFVDYFDKIPSEALRKLNQSFISVQEWLPIVEENFDLLTDALDQIDDVLKKTDRWIYIAYDELDKLATSYDALAAPIRELLAFWLDRWRRWQRIRPKIFLRNDLFNSKFLKFPDASKLKPHQLQLEWTTSWLYRLLIKRLANASEEMKIYISNINGIITDEDKNLGYIPSSDDKLHQEFMVQLVGRFMGANARKGDSYKWVPNHLQDAGKKIAPRSFLKLFANAAVIELNRFDESLLLGERLLQPQSLQGALMETSNDRIAELAEEYPWLDSLRRTLYGITVPSEREILLQAVENAKWNLKEFPPVEDPGELLEYMKSLGILENRTDGRVNMPEIYLYGFKMKRKGGVRRPN